MDRLRTRLDSLRRCYRFPGATRASLFWLPTLGIRQTAAPCCASARNPRPSRCMRLASGARTDPSAYLPAASAINRLRCALQNFAGRLAHFRCQCHRRGDYSSYAMLRNLFFIDHRARSTDSSISLSASFPASPSGGRRLPFPPHARQMLPSVGRLAFGISLRPRPLQAWHTQSSQCATAPPASSYGSR